MLAKSLKETSITDFSVTRYKKFLDLDKSHLVPLEGCLYRGLTVYLSSVTVIEMN